VKVLTDRGELTVFDDDDPNDEYGLFDYAHTLAGHTLTINGEYYLEPSGITGIYMIRKKVKKK
jgi:hypothetical protein